MSAQLRDVLRSVKSIRREHALKEGHRTSSRVFANSAGHTMDQSRVSKVFKRVLKAAGLPHHYTPHVSVRLPSTLCRSRHNRHTFGSLLLAQGAPLTYVARQMGHASLETTLRYYARWIPDLLILGERAWNLSVRLRRPEDASSATS
jgi:integrase